MKQLTTDQKIDYIYWELKKQKRNGYVKLFFKLIVLWIIAYYIYMIYNYGYQNLLQDLLDLILPSVQNAVEGLVEKNTSNIVESVKSKVDTIDIEALKQKAAELNVNY